MKIVKVSMAGANEYLPESEIIQFLYAYPFAEIAIGVSAEKGGFGTPRFDWVRSLQKQFNIRKWEAQLRRGRTMGTIALHVNGSGKDGPDGWPYQTLNGVLADALSDMMPFIGMSLQINSFGYEIPAQSAERFAGSRDLAEKIFTRSRLILSYSEKSKAYIETFHTALNRFYGFWPDADILFDASFGRGKMVNKYRAPVFPGVRQGYAGGFSPENIQRELGKISDIVDHSDPNATVWIDAEGKLKRDDGKTLDLDKAAVFCEKIRAFGR
jgi:hypothetical protein